MFAKLLIAGLALLATACVPIPPAATPAEVPGSSAEAPAVPEPTSKPAGPCILNEQVLLVGETVKAQTSSYLPGYVDIMRVESDVNDGYLTVVFYLRDIPQELTFYREGMEYGSIEYSWIVLISEDGQVEPWVNDTERQTSFKYRLKTAHFATEGEEMVPKSAPISSVAHTDVWELKYDDDGTSEYPWYITTIESATMAISHELNTLTMSGFVPGVSKDSLLVFETSDYQLGSDHIRCEPTAVSPQTTNTLAHNP